MFFWHLLLILLIYGVLILGSTYVIRRYFKVEQHSWFSHHFVNDKHEQIDKFIRNFSVILILIGAVINISRDLGNELWYFEPWNILFGSILVGLIFRAIMEKQFVENKNYYKATIAETMVYALVIFISYQTNFFGITV